MAWHRGELAVQARAGVDPAWSAAAAAAVRPFLTPQHRSFYPSLPFIVVGAVDDDGAPWATLLEGLPGFLQPADDTHLHIAAHPDVGDPATSGLRDGSAVGLLGIQLETRRRNRLNGHVERSDAGGVLVAVDGAFGNCPQYIHTRDLAPTEQRNAASTETLPSLDDEARATIRRAPTFFVASYVDIDGRHVDVSHRGGRPGFVAVDGDVLTIPDFAGNHYFNTLGNLVANPRAGLLFPDFETGDVLQLTGSADVVFDGPDLAAFEGAERLWRVRVQRVVRRRGALRWRGVVRDESAEAERTGTWAEARGRQGVTADGDAGWRPFEVEQVVDETADIRSFHLRPLAPCAVPVASAGMHLVLRLPRSATRPAIVRSYSLSRLPRDGRLRISVKRSGVGSSAFHETLRVGERVELRGPQGDFVVDGASARPLVLLSAGIGITPMLAMAEQVIAADRRDGVSRAIHFLHGARDGRGMPFQAELEALETAAAGALHVVRLFSAPGAQDVPGADYEARGRLDIAAVKRALPLDDYDWYVCGPAAFMQSLYDGLRGLGIADGRIHAEAFGPSSLRRTDEGAAHAPAVLAASGAVPVTFVKSRRTATWLPGSGTLLELAEAHGLQPEFGCRNGSCGTCRVRVDDGAVAYPGRVAPPGATGTALICCAVPAAGAAAGGLSLDL